MILSTSGNLGLGVTPSAWGSNVTALELPQSVSLYSWNASAVPQLYLGANHYWDGSNWRYKIAGQLATLYYQAVGQHIWYNAPSGTTAGDIITFTQAMTLTAAGNLDFGNGSKIRMQNPSMMIDGLTPSYFGYSSGYGILLVGHPGLSNRSIAFGVDVTANPSGAFGGTGSEYVWKNVGYFITPNSINNGYNSLLSWNSSGQVTIPGATTIGSLTSGSINVNSGAVININSQNGFQLGADAFSSGFYVYDNTASVYRFKIANGGAATFSSSVTTGAPSGGTAQPWKLGGFTSGTFAQGVKVRVEINGVAYDLLTT